MTDNALIQEEVDKNYQAFQAALPELLKQHPGEFAVIRHQKVTQFSHSVEGAVRFAVAEYPDGLFSIQEITEATADQGFFSNAIALSAL